MREQRCCMCPKTKGEESNVCPGIPGTHHPRRTSCGFANIWRDENGETVFVSSGLGKRKFMSFRRSASGGLHRVKTKFLPVRNNFDDAQEDLNLYARKKGWKLGEKYYARRHKNEKRRIHD